eukprot:TRINITY_DN48657_c0_g1_i1.p1 TRINITY_DN48657_c0_g1~~TRINITY_DN48657_c0_g1_i1.p1  ORF type:complete len:509 (+),score=70.04 TRINITY_DN48657_c0_g1_i1:65-1528(+)
MASKLLIGALVAGNAAVVRAVAFGSHREAQGCSAEVQLDSVELLQRREHAVPKSLGKQHSMHAHEHGPRCGERVLQERLSRGERPAPRRAMRGAFVNGSKAAAAAPCINGQAVGLESFPCKSIDLYSFVPLEEFFPGSGGANDVWGWTDATTGKEYAIMGLAEGTGFVDVSERTSPVVLGVLPSRTVASVWRDIKVYADHALIVSEAPDHGMQVFDLRRLRSGRPASGTFAADANYTGIGSAHNVVVNHERATAYVVGAKGGDTDACDGGLHIVDISSPLQPTFVSCFRDDGYTHDAECVVYRGPDSAYSNRDICFAYNEDSLTIVDVTVKASPVMISRTGYDGAHYTHQGSLDASHTFAFMNDELDEEHSDDKHTKTYVWDLSSLKAPKLVNVFRSSQESIDHNNYVHNHKLYQANYCAGLRVLNIDDSTVQGGTGPELSEVAYFDVAPECASATFAGSWSVYPFFPSGTIIVSSIERGLFVLAMA